MEALNIERAVTGARLTNCSRAPNFTPPPNSSSSPLKAKQSGFAGNREKLSVSLRLKRQNSQTLLATQEGEEQAGRGGASRLVKKQRSIPDMPPEERRA